MEFLVSWISSFIDTISTQVREVCSADAFLSSRPNIIPKICDAGSDQDAKHEEVQVLPIWILDSGASFHAVGDRSLFSPLFGFRTATPAGTAATYQAHDGRVLTVAGVGTISCDNFHLCNVLYVPDLRSRVVLVSVQQLAERDYLVMFGGGQCCVKDVSSGKIVGKGRLHDDDALYHLEFLEIPPDTARVCVTAAP